MNGARHKSFRPIFSLNTFFFFFFEILSKGDTKYSCKKIFISTWALSNSSAAFKYFLRPYRHWASRKKFRHLTQFLLPPPSPEYQNKKKKLAKKYVSAAIYMTMRRRRRKYKTYLIAMNEKSCYKKGFMPHGMFFFSFRM